MDECIVALGDATIFSTIEANSSYWHVESAKADGVKTAFASHHVLFQLTCMLFGLKNAPLTFRRAMDVVLSTVHWLFGFVDVDDIVIFSKSREAHIKQVKHGPTLLCNDW